MNFISRIWNWLFQVPPPQWSIPDEELGANEAYVRPESIFSDFYYATAFEKDKWTVQQISPYGLPAICWNLSQGEAIEIMLRLDQLRRMKQVRKGYVEMPRKGSL